MISLIKFMGFQVPNNNISVLPSIYITCLFCGHILPPNTQNMFNESLYQGLIP
jgi:hypothetical protein